MYRIDIKDIKNLTTGLGLYAPTILKADIDINYIMPANYTGHMLALFDTGKLAKITMESFKSSTRKIKNALNPKANVVKMLWIPTECEMELIGSKKNVIVDTSTINSKTTRTTQGINILKGKNKLISFKLNKIA